MFLCGQRSENIECKMNVKMQQWCRRGSVAERPVSYPENEKKKKKQETRQKRQSWLKEFFDHNQWYVVCELQVLDVKEIATSSLQRVTSLALVQVLVAARFDVSFDNLG